MTESDAIARSLEAAKDDKITELFPYEMPFRASRLIGLVIITKCV